MANTPFFKSNLYVLIKKNMHAVYNSEGKEIKSVIISNITDNTDCEPTITLTAGCNLVSSEQEMMEVIAGFKND